MANAICSWGPFVALYFYYSATKNFVCVLRLAAGCVAVVFRANDSGGSGGHDFCACAFPRS